MSVNQTRTRQSPRGCVIEPLARINRGRWWPFIGILQPLADAAVKACESGEQVARPLIGVVTRQQKNKTSQPDLEKGKGRETGTEIPAPVQADKSVVAEQPAQTEDAEDVPMRGENSYFKCPKDLEGWNLDIWVSEQRNEANTEVARLRKFLADKPENTRYNLR